MIGHVLTRDTHVIPYMPLSRHSWLVKSCAPWSCNKLIDFADYRWNDAPIRFDPVVLQISSVVDFGAGPLIRSEDR